MKKAILIDAKNKKVTEVEADTLQDYYQLIGCDYVEAIDLKEDTTMYVDEESLLKSAYIDENGEKHGMHGFNIPQLPNTIIGNGLVLGFEYESGETKDCPMSVEQIEKMITFVEYDNPQDRPQPSIQVYSW